MARTFMEGMIFIEKASFDNFNEGTTLIDSQARPAPMATAKAVERVDFDAFALGFAV